MPQPAATSKQRPPQRQSKAVVSQRLTKALNAAETKQLHSYIKERSDVLDAEVKRLTEKLDLASRPLELKTSTVSSLLSPNHAQLSPHKVIPVNAGLELHGVGIDLQQRTTSGENAPSEISRFIASLTKAVKSSGVSPQEFRDILFPPDIVGPNATIISLSEFVDVLNLDLLMSVSETEQQVLLKEYGVVDDQNNRLGEINAKDLLLDADMWSAPFSATGAASARTRVEASMPVNTRASVRALETIHASIQRAVSQGQRIARLDADSTRSQLMTDRPAPVLEDRSLDDATEDALVSERGPPEYTASSASALDETLMRELFDLRSFVAGLDDSSGTRVQRAVSSAEDSEPYVSTRGTAGLNQSRTLRAGLTDSTKESLRELDRGTWFSQPDRRKPGNTWSHPLVGVRASVPTSALLAQAYMVGKATSVMSTDELDVVKLCEKNLVDSIMRLRDPASALECLIHRIIEVSDRENGDGYITSQQLQDEFHRIGVHTPTTEVVVFATGFGGNGRGGVNATEVRGTLEGLYYDRVKSSTTGRLKDSGKVVDEGSGRQDVWLDDEAETIMKRVAYATLSSSTRLRDQESTLGSTGMSVAKRESTRDGILKSLLQPLEALDKWSQGFLSFPVFCKGLFQIIGVEDAENDSPFASRSDRVTKLEIRRLAEFFASPDMRDSDPRRDEREVSSSRKKVDRALRKVNTDQYLGRHTSSEFISRDFSSKNSYLDVYSDDDEEDDRSEVSQEEETKTPFVMYVSFCQSLLSCLIQVRKSMKLQTTTVKVQSNPTSAATWLEREFELLELLIFQLEAMTGRQRRKAIMKLSQNASSLVRGDIGVPLQYNRKKQEADGFAVLKYLTEAGFSFERLTRVQLLRSVEELGGLVDFSELCEMLFKTCAHWSDDEKSIVSKVLNAMGATASDRRLWLARFKQSLFQSAADAELKLHGKENKPHPTRGSVKPAQKNPIAVSRSRIARDDDTTLDSIEAILQKGVSPSIFLRCLRVSGVFLDVSEEASLLDCLDTERTILHAQDETRVDNSDSDMVALPLVHYKSFLSFCCRFVGHWSDAFPELSEYLKKLVANSDDASAGRHVRDLGQLLRSFGEKTGVSDNDYVSEREFMIACSRSRLLADLPIDLLQKLASILCTEDDAGRDRVHYSSFLAYLQLLVSSSSSAAASNVPESIASQLLEHSIDSNGLLRPIRTWLSDIEDPCAPMTDLQVRAMLKYFKIPYKSAEIVSFVEDVHGSRISLLPSTSIPYTQHGVGVSACDVISFLQKRRGLHLPSSLCSKIYKLISFQANSKDSPGSSHVSSSVLKIARQTSAKLRVFSHGKYISLDVFYRICHSCGILLSFEEADLLADYTDELPSGRQVRWSVVTEAVVTHLKHMDSHVDGLRWVCVLRDKLASLLSESTTKGASLQSDVWNAFRGFDVDGTGVMKRCDFLLALTSLKIPSKGVDEVDCEMPANELVSYIPVLNAALKRSSSTDRFERLDKQGTRVDEEMPAVVKALIDQTRAVVLQLIDSSAEKDVWNYLLRVFRSYDDDSSFSITSAEFRQALYIIVQDSDVIDSQTEKWDVLIAYFKRGGGEAGVVNYMSFCELVVGVGDVGGAGSSAVKAKPKAGTARPGSARKTDSKGSSRAAVVSSRSNFR